MSSWWILLVSLCLLTSGQEATETSVVEEAQDKEQYNFQAEVANLMDIIINSLYLNKEVFLRELISNASDAMDKIRLEKLKEGSTDDSELEIRIKYDPDHMTLSIRDTGIGMTKEDLIEKLGTVAKSGTTQFIDALAASGGDINLIGQFGVGFYSSFLAANKVTVISKSDNDPDQHIWVSHAGPYFSVAKDPRGNTLNRGTEVILSLKPDAEEFTEPEHIKKVVQQYSEFVDYPIYLYEYHDKSIEVDMTEEELEKKNEENAEKMQRLQEQRDEQIRKREEEGDPMTQEELDRPLLRPDEEEEMNKTTKMERRKVWEWVKVNAQKAIWLRDRSENTIVEYVKLYQTLKKDASEPLWVTHFSGEGDVEFKAIIFIPDSPPADMFDNYYKKESGLRLYVRRVLISDSYTEFVPKYLSYLKGVIHSDDLPLNVSRETLQQERVMKILANKITKKVLDSLKAIADGKDEWNTPPETEEDKEKKEDPDEEKARQIMLRWRRKTPEQKYEAFWEDYGKTIKLGVMEDASNRNRLVNLLRFSSSKSKDKLISLEQYVENMKEDQEFIYYIAGEDKTALLNSPLMEKVLDMDFEVLIMDDPLDEFAMSHISEFKEKRFQNLGRSNVNLGENTSYDEKRRQALKEHYQPLTDWWKKLLGKEVDRVTVSDRLLKSPCAISSGDQGYTANMERITRAQAYANQGKFPSHNAAKKVLEIHPGHPAIRKLLDYVEADPDSNQVKDYGWLLFYTATIPSGFPPREDTDYTSRMYRVLRNKMGVSPSEPIEDPDIPIEFQEPEEEEEEQFEAEDIESLDQDEPLAGVGDVEFNDVEEDKKTEL